MTREGETNRRQLQRRDTPHAMEAGLQDFAELTRQRPSNSQEPDPPAQHSRLQRAMNSGSFTPIRCTPALLAAEAKSAEEIAGSLNIAAWLGSA